MVAAVLSCVRKTFALCAVLHIPDGHHNIVFRRVVQPIGAPAPSRKKKTVELAQGKWAEILIHTDRVTKVGKEKERRCQVTCHTFARGFVWCPVCCLVVNDLVIGRRMSGRVGARA